MSEHMDNLSFKYKIVPYVANNQNEGGSGITLANEKQDQTHSDQPYEDFDEENPLAQNMEDAIRSIYYYERSYFRTNTIQTNILPTLTYGKRLGEPEQFCLNLSWKTNQKNSTFAEVADQQRCESTQSDYKWGDSDPQTGISFPLYRFERLEDWRCRADEAKCRAKCEADGGQLEDDQCYALNVAHKICATVELDFLNGLAAEEAEIVTGVKLKGGCLQGGETVKFKRFSKYHS